jgi:hypothetical protein
MSVAVPLIAESWRKAPPTDRFVEVDVPELAFVALHGEGEPESPQFTAAVSALLAVSSGMAAAVRERTGRAPAVAPLEVLWPSGLDRADWTWTTLIRQPDEADEGMLDAAIDRAFRRTPAAVDVHWMRYTEGRSVQITHLGPYSTEGRALIELHRHYLPEHGLEPNGPQHEIHLDGARHTGGRSRRMVLRQPVRAVI